MVATQSLSRLVILSEDARPSPRICGWPDDWTAGVVTSYQLRGGLSRDWTASSLSFWAAAFRHHSVLSQSAAANPAGKSHTWAAVSDNSVFPPAPAVHAFRCK